MVQMGNNAVYRVTYTIGQSADGLWYAGPVGAASYFIIVWGLSSKLDYISALALAKLSSQNKNLDQQYHRCLAKLWQMDA